MRSDTLTPLYQFIQWLGIDGWKASGIDRYDQAGNTTVFNNNIQKNNLECICLFQHPWDSNKHWSRDELIEILKYAERMFVLESGLYPAPKYISEERKPYKSRTIRPKFPCGDLIYGQRVLVPEVRDLPIVRDDIGDGSGDILDDFTLTFTIPQTYNVEDIRVYFTSDDCPECDDDVMEFNDHICEIRPLDCIELVDDGNDNWNVTLTAPAFLFKDPALDSVANCLDHDFPTYVETVDIFLEDVDPCDQGYFICDNSHCQPDCGQLAYTSCVATKLVYEQRWAMPLVKKCRLDPITELPVINLNTGRPYYDTYCLPCHPAEFELYYTTGKSLVKGRRIDENCFPVIAKLAIAMSPCIKEWCECEVCVNQKISYYRDYQKAITKDDKDGGDFDRWYQVMVDKVGLRFADGLNPTRGIIEAMRDIYQFSCKKGGTYI